MKKKTPLFLFTLFTLLITVSCSSYKSDYIIPEGSLKGRSFYASPQGVMTTLLSMKESFVVVGSGNLKKDRVGLVFLTEEEGYLHTSINLIGVEQKKPFTYITENSSIYITLKENSRKKTEYTAVSRDKIVKNSIEFFQFETLLVEGTLLP